MLNETVKTVVVDGNEEILFEMESGRKFRLYHNQSCCENVVIHKVEGDIQSLVGKKIEKYGATWDNELPTGIEPGTIESFTRSLFVINDILIECFGESNGYYNEAMKIEETT